MTGSTSTAEMIKKTIRITLFIGTALLTLTVGLVLGALVRSHREEPKGAVSTDTTSVKVSSHRDENGTHFYVHNSELSEVTMTFDFKLVNMESEVKFPYTATFRPGETKAFTLRPDDSGGKWEFSYTNYYKLGSSVAVPDSTVYLLPYAPGESFRVTQAYGGSFSHKGSNKYAIDWKMPEGTPVHAARGGLVVKVKDDSNTGGSSIKYDKYNNYVLIRHEDGTLGHYCHLQHRSVMVKPGQIVRAGDSIALSGNTGFSSGPHLHFAVFRTLDGKQRESIPVRFKDSAGDGVILQAGRRYTAPELEPVQSAQLETESATALR